MSSEVLVPKDAQEALEERIDSASSARSLLSNLLDSDRLSDERRAEIQGIIDGNPPYKDEDLREAEQEDRVNVNWGHAEAKVDNATIPYFDAIVSVPEFVKVQTAYGKNKQQRDKWSRIINKHLHNTLSKSKRFLLTQQLVQRNLVIHGIGTGSWRDSKDWNAQSFPPSCLVPPQRASVDWTEWEYCFILDEILPTTLYKYIRKPEIGRKNGWDVDQCWEAIRNAAEKQEDRERPAEWWQSEMKNNSLLSGQARSKVIRLAHLYIRQFNGRWGHYVFDRDNNTEWLAKRPEVYESLSNAITLFLSNVGNEYIAGVRGIGQRVYKYAEAMNRVNNALIEGVIIQSATMLSVESGGDVSKLQTLKIGPLRILPPGVKVQQVNTQTNLAGPMQVAQYFQGQEAEQLASFNPSLNNFGGKRNAKQLEIEMGDKAQLSNTRFEIYMRCLDAFYEETYRRISNPNLLPEDPGGKEALAFQRRCIEDGVPAAALIAIESVTATRSIGQGSSAARIMAMTQIGKFAPMLPEDKRNNVIRDSIAAIGGQDFVDRYAPDLEEYPTGVDASIASLENNAFMQGGQIILDPNQNHYIHASVHIQFFGEITKATQQQKLHPKEALKALQAGGPHLLLHLKYLEQDPTRKSQFNELNQQAAELMKIADQIAKFAERLEEQEQQPQEPQVSPEMIKAQVEAGIKQQTAENDMQIKRAKAEQQMRIKDQTASQRLQIANIESQQRQRRSQFEE